MVSNNLPIEDFGRLIENRIRKAVKSRNVDLGWRFLSCPLKNIDTAKIAFIGINPGGRNKDIRNDGLSSEAGSAYVIERWGDFGAGKAPLQKQVLALFELLGEPADDVLSGNLIPFRSKSLSDLEDTKAAAAFGSELWTDIFGRSPAKLIMTMGGHTTKTISQLLDIPTSNSYQSGWGNVSIRVGKKNGRTLVGLPHLSTFKLLSRPKCVKVLKEIFKNQPELRGSIR